MLETTNSGTQAGPKKWAGWMMVWLVIVGPTLGAAQTLNQGGELLCDGIPFVKNVFWTTKYGPAAANIIEAPSNMLACTGGDYALCYYAGAEPSPCKTDPGKGVAYCECEKFTASAEEVYMVDINSILNTCVYIETIAKCGHDGSGCGVDDAPVCDYIRNNTLIPGADLISTFSTECVDDYQFGSTSCEGFYAGCMTAPCWEKPDAEGNAQVICECPLYDGPYQFGRAGGECDAGSGLVWSAANSVISTGSGGGGFAGLDSATIGCPPGGSTNE